MLCREGKGRDAVLKLTVMLKLRAQNDPVALGRQRRSVQAENGLFGALVVHGHPGIVHKQ